jgi:two-component system response regulator AtoC
MPDRVLVLEPDKKTRERLASFLTEGGATPLEAESVDAALDLLAHSPVEMAFCAHDPGQFEGDDASAALLELAPDLLLILVDSGQKDTRSRQITPEDAVPCPSWAWDLIPRGATRSIVLHAFHRARTHRHLVQTSMQRAREAALHQSDPLLVAASRPMVALLEQVEQAAQGSEIVLISGEAGTGKASVARAIHDQSARRTGPFVRAAMDADGASATLYSLPRATRGDTTTALGPRPSPDAFELARGGSLYFEGLTGAAASQLSTRLARPTTGSPGAPIPKDTGRPTPRIISAHRDPDVLMGSHAVLLEQRTPIRLHVPSLRDRLVDLPLLADLQLRRLSAIRGTPLLAISDSALAALLAYAWPGNVEELQWVLSRAALRCRGGRIEQADLPIEIADRRPASLALPQATGESTDTHPAFALRPARRRFEAALIRRALESTGGNRSDTARLLEISHRSLLYKIREYGIKD